MVRLHLTGNYPVVTRQVRPRERAAELVGRLKNRAQRVTGHLRGPLRTQHVLRRCAAHPMNTDFHNPRGGTRRAGGRRRVFLAAR